MTWERTTFIRECKNAWSCKLLIDRSTSNNKLDLLLEEMQSLAAVILTNVSESNNSLNTSTEELSWMELDASWTERLWSVVKKITDILLRQKEQNSTIETSVLKMVENLQQENEQLQRDELTWLYNRHRYYKEFDRLTALYNKSGREFSGAIIDIDNFKTINDTHNHTVWDSVLRFLAKELKVRFAENQLFRFGWEEFLILFEGSVDELRHRLSELLTFLNKTRILYKQKTHIPLTFSGWCVPYEKWEDNFSLYTRADERMFEAKRSWKNKVI